MEHKVHDAPLDSLDLTQGKMPILQEIEALLSARFGEGHYRIHSFTGGEHRHIHMEVHVYGPFFEGLSLVEQHRMVMDALKEKMRKEIHAIIIKTGTKFV